MALFNAGKIVLIGTVAELGRQVLGGGYAVEVEADGGEGIAKRLSALPGVRSVEQPGPGRFRMTCDAICAARQRQRWWPPAGGSSSFRSTIRAWRPIYTRYFHNAQEARDAA